MKLLELGFDPIAGMVKAKADDTYAQKKSEAGVSVGDLLWLTPRMAGYHGVVRVKKIWNRNGWPAYDVRVIRTGGYNQIGFAKGDVKTFTFDQVRSAKKISKASQATLSYAVGGTPAT